MAQQKCIFVRPFIVLMMGKLLKRGIFVYPPLLNIFVTTRFDLWIFKGARDIFVFGI
jgi:hypothetical protein